MPYSCKLCTCTCTQSCSSITKATSSDDHQQRNSPIQLWEYACLNLQHYRDKNTAYTYVHDVHVYVNLTEFDRR